MLLFIVTGFRMTTAGRATAVATVAADRANDALQHMEAGWPAWRWNVDEVLSETVAAAPAPQCIHLLTISADGRVNHVKL